MGVRFTEIYPEIDGGLSFGVERFIYSAKSEFQKIDIVQTHGFGKVLLIDDLVMLTERDEFIYHEMIAHVPLYAHPNPRSILIIGGGDGGTVRESLKHPSIERIDLVDIDRMVSEACVAHLPTVASKLMAEKVHCHFEDGVAYAKNCKIKYDVVIIDSTDPISVGEGLFSEAFYRSCYDCLRENGILVNQSESPAWMPAVVARISAKLKAVFPRVFFYQASIPTYPSGHWAFGFASKGLHPIEDFRRDRYNSDSLTLNYYNDAIHAASFALPNFFKEIVGES